jgi:hypothetical protein
VRPSLLPGGSTGLPPLSRASRSTTRSPTIFNRLDEAGVRWKIYQSDVAFALVYAYVRNHPAGNLVGIREYFHDAAAGTLPQVAFVDPAFLGAAENDEHPLTNVQVGEAFVASVVGAFVQSPNWSRGALFLTYDEHGGYFDHVPPPAACVPDDIPRRLNPGDVVAAFDHSGIRVPLVAVSPFARKHYVSHVVTDDTSILRFIETRFDLPALTRRDANASPLLDLFDFAHPSFVKPPRLPTARVNEHKAARCAEISGGSSGLRTARRSSRAPSGSQLTRSAGRHAEPGCAQELAATRLTTSRPRHVTTKPLAFVRHQNFHGTAIARSRAGNMSRLSRALFSRSSHGARQSLLERERRDTTRFPAPLRRHARRAPLIIPGRDARMSGLAKRLMPGVVERTMDRAMARVRR